MQRSQSEERSFRSISAVKFEVWFRHNPCSSSNMDKQDRVPKGLRQVTELGRLLSVYRKGWFDKALHLILYGGYWVVCLFILGSGATSKSNWTGTNAFIMGCMIAAGAYWTWRVSMWWKKTIGVYEEGLAVVQRGELKSYRWDELAWIKMLNLVTTVNFLSSRYRRCEISPVAGESFTVTNGVAAGPEFFDAVERRTFPYFWHAAAEAYNSGEWVDFGPIRISKSSGLEIRGKLFDWNNLSPITIRNGTIYIAPLKGKLFGTKSVSAHKVHNLSVCVKLIQDLLQKRWV